LWSRCCFCPSFRPAPTAVRNTFLPKPMRPCRASVCGLLVGLTTRNRWNIRLPASWPWRWPWFVPDMRVWTDLFGVLFGAAHFLCVVARWLACGGLSDACRRPSSFSLRAQREGTKRNGLWSPPTLQALALEGVGTDRTLSVRPAATPHRRPQLRPGRGCRGLRYFARSHLTGPFDLDLSTVYLTGMDASRVDGRLSETHPGKT
jgi:hypothetical protein